ncbi:MAG TPA: ATP-dependent DNA helicase, partial [Flavobacterium sp.]|nr:ATP-dependent DNA helicase [Flavobacterium sp.]
LDIFGDLDKSKLRLSKPISGIPPKSFSNAENESKSIIRKLKPVSGTNPDAKTNLIDNNLIAGCVIMHDRFGKGEVLSIEGVGADKKAEIRFDVGGIKKLLLRFAKLEIIAQKN